MSRFAGQEDTVAERLGQYLACGLRARRGGRGGAEHPRLVVPTRRVAALGDTFHLPAVKTAQPNYSKIHHRRLALGGEIVPEIPPNIDHANGGTRSIGQDCRRLLALTLLEY